MAKKVRKQRSIRFHDSEWAELVEAAGHETERRGDVVDAGTLSRELTLRGVRRINARMRTLRGAKAKAA